MAESIHGQKENCLTPLSEEEPRENVLYKEKREKAAGSEDCKKEFPCSCGKQHFSDWANLLRKERTEKAEPFDAGSENWEKENPWVQKVYSYEEKRLKALLDGEGYDKWEKENLLWEIENDLVPLAGEVSYEVKSQKAPFDTGSENWEKENLLSEKRQKDLVGSLGKLKFCKRLEELSSRPLTEEEKRLKQLYLENMEIARLDLNSEPFNPSGPEWELAYYTGPDNLLQQFRKASARAPLEEGRTVPLTPERHLFRKKPPAEGCSTVSPCVISREEKREKLEAQGRCLIGSYLTPYCKCDSQCSGFKIPLEEYPPEIVPICLAYLRQCRLSHCFDIDDYPGSSFGASVRFGGSVGPIAPSQDFNSKAELLMELANRAIQDYNEKECNVFKYKVLKIEKVNYSVAQYDQYWMTVKVLNLTLGTPIETFEIHAGISCFGDDKKIYCCRLKEEGVVGLPSCEFCFGLLSEGHVTGRKEEALEL